MKNGKMKRFAHGACLLVMAVLILSLLFMLLPQFPTTGERPCAREQNGRAQPGRLKSRAPAACSVSVSSYLSFQFPLCDVLL